MQKAFHILKFAWPFLRPYRWRLGFSLGTAALFGLSNALVLWTVKSVLARLEGEVPVAAQNLPEGVASAALSWTDRIQSLKDTINALSHQWATQWLPGFGEPLTTQHILGACLLVPLIAAFRGSMEFFSKYGIGWVGERVVNDLRIKVFGTLSHLSLDYFNQAKMGDMITRINGDTAMLQTCLSSGIRNSITSPMTVLSVLALLLILDWQLTCYLFLVMPVAIACIVIFGRKARKASRKAVMAHVDQSSLIVEMLQSIRVIKAYALERLQNERFARLSRQVFGFNMKTIRSQEKVGPLVESMGVGLMGGLILFVVATNRQMSDMVAFFAGLATFYSPVKKLASLHVMIEKTSVGVERLMQILSQQPTVQDTKNPLPVHDFRESIVFKQVDFAYESQRVIEKLDLTLPKGQKLGIAGESGSGKSTLINLLLRFFDPSSGEILLDGKPYSKIAQEDLRRLMALVSQDVVLFDQSVHENIALGRDGASAEEIHKAAAKAHANSFIEKLPKGYDTMLGERGISLSGGQRQRIAIARAFVRDAPILILDEATAALDSASEAEVQSAIDELSEERTVVCIAHRLSTLKQMDRILVLSHGRIIEDGTFEALMQRGGHFARMAKAQGMEANHK